MPQYAQGINIDKACMLIALDRMFSPDEWGREEFHDYFLEFGSNGFSNTHSYFLEECAPILALRGGDYQICYNQGDTYVRIINHKTLVRYRVSIHKTVIYCYRTGDYTSHAVAIYADELLFYINNTKYVDLYLPTNGLIVDTVKELE